METGEKLKLQPSQFKDKYNEAVKTYFDDLAMKCADNSIDFMPADIGKGFNDVLLKYLLKRQKLH